MAKLWRSGGHRPPDRRGAGDRRRSWMAGRYWRALRAELRDRGVWVPRRGRIHARGRRRARWWVVLGLSRGLLVFRRSALGRSDCCDQRSR